MQKIFTLILVIIVTFSLFAQNNYWMDVTENQIPQSSERYIIPDSYRTVKINLTEIKTLLHFAPMEFTNRALEGNYIISLPMPDGSFQKFSFWESPTMEKELQDQFPEIRTYTGQGIDDPYATLKLDLTSLGFHAQILSPNGRVFIDPYSLHDVNNYISYYTKNYRKFNDDFTCELYTHDEYLEPEITNNNFSYTAIGSQLRTYRLANAATGEYTAFFGGTQALGMAAITTSVNRVNGVYEREVGIRMVLVANNINLVYTNASTDPYSNTNGSAMLTQNITTCNSVIGSANYDIGHVFSTGGGGVAYLGCVCTSNKAGGVTGSSSPVGDPFDIDYVAHEMGHQFGANHTFNSVTGSCGGGNRNASTAYEPGSGSTIMAYAGICGADNLQSNSDPYFHTISFDEIVAYTNSGSGNSCAVITSTGNNAPVVTVPSGGFYIPINTPFALTGSATDPNGDALTYCWEEFDLGPSGSPGSPSGTAPIFRCWSPTTSSTRTFPRLSDLINNTTVIGELLPTYTRALNFRLTVRDNKAGGGGVDWKLISFNADASAGPFTVTSPNTSVSWIGNTSQTITWNVANTNTGNVNCANVKISLSTDGGNTFPTVILASTPNDGSEVITLPNLPTTQARIKVEAVGNIFFDISNVNFTIASNPIPNNPVSFEAVSVSAAQINLNFSTNINNNNVVIVWNQTGIFTTPSGAPPSVGSSFAGGTLLYNGTTSPQIHTDLSANTTYYYKAFSYNGSNYSSGLNSSATTLSVQNPQNFEAIPISSNSILLSFTQNFSLNNVIIVWNYTGIFSSPAGNPPAIGQPFAGGILLYNGNSSPQFHSGLNSNTQYFYKAFSFNGVNYSDGLSSSATTLQGTQTFQFSVTLNDGWNMVSIPGLHPTDQNINTWFAFRNQLADVYFWDQGAYSSATSLTPTRGYWMLHSGNRIYNTGDEWPAGGINYVSHNPISINAGWNLIGCYEQSLPVNGLTTTPPNLIVPNTIYAWNNGYYQPDSLKPGLSYWILLNGSGVINTDLLLKNTIQKNEENKKDWNKILFSDDANRNFCLYLTDQADNLETYTLPPLPPGDAFDIRFNSGRYVESLKNEVLKVQLQGVKFPLTIKFNDLDILIKDSYGNNLAANKNQNGEIILLDNTVTYLTLSKNIIPKEFSLEQNYPNPFNPETNIRFALPESDNIKLTVYNTLGELVAVLAEGFYEAGVHDVNFNAGSITSGIYFYKLESDQLTQVRKMIILK